MRGSTGIGLTVSFLAFGLAIAGAGMGAARGQGAPKDGPQGPPKDEPRGAPAESAGKDALAQEAALGSAIDDAVGVLEREVPRGRPYRVAVLPLTGPGSAEGESGLGRY